MRASWLMVLAPTILICSCSGNGTSDPPPVLTVLQVAGTYTTTVTLEASSCTGITVQSNPTTIAHSPGATALTVTHAGQSYSGTVDTGGHFTTTPRTIVAGGASHRLTIDGTFAVRGFDATVDVAVTYASGAAPCTYRVHWAGVKQGSDNVIPGSG